VREWLKEKLDELKESKVVERLCEVSDVHYVAHTWTPLKLIALAYWVGVYTRIIPRHFNTFWYLDLLAGPGTDLIKETGDVIVGSPFIAHFLARRPFSRYVLVELDEERYRALRERALALSLPASIYHGDCNVIVRGLGLNADHMLVFADCEGLDVHWATIDKLLNRPSDLLLLFQTKELNRTLGRARQGLGDEKKLELFMGDSTWRQAEDADELLELYMVKLLQYRDYVSNIKIRGRFEYDLILACKQGPYVKAWEELKRRLEAVTDEDAELALRMLKGEVKALDKFFSRQRKLSEFI